MLTCRKAAELLLDFIENSLTPELHGAMHHHLQNCTFCHQFLDSYKKTAQLCQRVQQGPTPTDMGERLLTYLRRETGGKSS